MKRILTLLTLIFCVLVVVVSHIVAHFNYEAFFSLKNGHIQTYYNIGSMRIWSSVREDFSREFMEKISPRMPDIQIRITAGRFKTYYNLRGYKCYKELKGLFLDQKKYSKEQIAEEAHRIVLKHNELYK